MKVAFLSLWFLFLLSCTKENDPVNSEIKKNFFFAPSSYWVYQDSLSGNVDSLVVTRYTDTMVNTSVEIDDVLTLHLNRYRNNAVLDTLNTLWMLQTTGVHINYFVSPTIGTVFFSVWYPYESGPGGVNADTSRYSVISVPHWQVNGQDYYPTARVAYTNKDTTAHDTFYIAPHVGMVQMIINHATLKENWKLLRYYVAK